MSELQVRFTGKTGEIDGYMEMVLGIFWATGLMLDYTMNKRQRPNSTTQIYLTLQMDTPPLGHMGESDIPDISNNG